MAYNPLFITSENRNLTGKKLPLISQNLDSIRAYQWEVTFTNLPNAVASLFKGVSRPLTFAAKSVSQTGYATEDIEVHRVNDKVYYPGKGSPEELTIVFDNLYKPKMAHLLYSWMQTIYDPVTGQFTKSRTVNGGGSFKASAEIYQLDNLGQPLSHTKLYGLYPKSWKQAEFNYSTNEFHTVEVTFRYDFIVQSDNTGT